MKPPVPETTSPILPSRGYDYLRATRHDYIKSTQSSVELPDGTFEDVWLHWFACVDTGAERVWGYESRDSLKIPSKP